MEGQERGGQSSEWIVEVVGGCAEREDNGNSVGGSTVKCNMVIAHGCHHDDHGEVVDEDNCLDMKSSAEYNIHLPPTSLAEL
mmetsp:Transcript_277/g.661  ORF Transcript_277/g.661 Transcript_277/m.661 type:complete len:82 (-) Transcript_277:351-596(-)